MVQYPTPEQIWDAAEEVGLSLTEDDVKSYIGLIRPNIDAYNLVDAMPDYLPPVKYPRTPGYFPSVGEPRNAWYVRTSIKGASSGPLKGKKVAVKDNVMVAGVPMMNGDSILEGYVPDIDATVVAAHPRCRRQNRRQDPLRELLHVRRQPYQRERAGAQSVQDGLLRPAALRRAALSRWRWARPTWRSAAIRADPSACHLLVRNLRHEAHHGLVSYTGIMPIEIYVDHTGPITEEVEDNALLLEVLAGPDGYDSRQNQRQDASLYQGAAGRHQGHEESVS